MSQAASTAHLRINRRDKRCMMVNLDPQTATQDPAVLREIVLSFVGRYCTKDRESA